MKFSNSETYEGEFVNGRIEGNGLYTYLDGSSYKGDFLNEMKHG